MTRIYLDNAASTRPYNKLKYIPFYVYGNPSSRHEEGRFARKYLDDARKEVADAICALPREIVFTSGGTESNNMALKGPLFTALGKTQVVVSQIEHSSVMESCKWLSKIGLDIKYIPVDKEGFVDLEKLEKAVSPKTMIISVQLANNEIGTIQNLREISKIAKKNKVLLHTDAVQAVGAIPVNVNELGVDMLSMSAHKFHGFKGTGALYIRSGTEIEPLIHGGGQENGYRSGTENLYGICAMGKAIKKATESMKHDATHLIAKKNLLLKLLKEAGIKYKINGPEDMWKRLPNNLNLTFLDIEGGVKDSRTTRLLWNCMFEWFGVFRKFTQTEQGSKGDSLLCRENKWSSKV